MRARLEAGFDVGYLRQLFDYLVFVIGSLEAPARRQATQQVLAMARSPVLMACSGIFWDCQHVLHFSDQCCSPSRYTMAS